MAWSPWSCRDPPFCRGSWTWMKRTTTGRHTQHLGVLIWNDMDTQRTYKHHTWSTWMAGLKPHGHSNCVPESDLTWHDLRFQVWLWYDGMRSELKYVKFPWSKWLRDYHHFIHPIALNFTANNICQQIWSLGSIILGQCQGSDPLRCRPLWRNLGCSRRSWVKGMG